MFPWNSGNQREQHPVVCLQIQKIEDQQKRYQDLEKKAESKKTSDRFSETAEIKERNKMEQAYLDGQARILAAGLQDGMRVRYVVLFLIQKLCRLTFHRRNN